MKKNRKLKFKVGDKVKFVGASEYGVCTVTEVDREDREIPYRVEHDNGAETWATQSELRAYRAPKPAKRKAPQPAANTPPLKFKVGDRVSIANSDYSFGTIAEVDTTPHTTLPYRVNVVADVISIWCMESQLSPLVETAPPEICVGDIITVEAGDQTRTTDPHIVRNAKVIAINLVGTHKVYLAALPASVGWVAFDTTDKITLVKAGGAK